MQKLPADNFAPPDRVPPGGWKTTFRTTGGTIEGATFAEFVKNANHHLTANGLAPLEPWQLYSRVDAQAQPN